MSVNRLVVQSPMNQGETEIVSYVFDFTNWGGSPVSPLVKVWQGTSGSWADVTSAYMPSGSPSANGNYVTCQPMRNVQENRSYLVICTVTLNNGVGNTEAAKLEVIGEK